MGHDRDKNDPRVISKLKQGNILRGNQSLSENGKYREDVESICGIYFYIEMKYRTTNSHSVNTYFPVPT